MTKMQLPAIHAGLRSRTPWLASASLLFALAAGPAGAQWFGGPPGPFMYNRPPPVFRDARPLPPYAVVERLEDQGYVDVGRPRYNGSTYEIEATGLTGARVRIVVDAFRGNVIDRYAVSGARRGPDFGPGRGRPDEERGWFGNNVPPPEDAPGPRRYSNRPLPEDDLQDFLDRPERPIGARPRLDAAPLEELRPTQPPRAADQPREIPERQAARPDPSNPGAKPEGLGHGPKVEGLNPDASKNSDTPRSPEAAKPVAPRHERASRPEPNRQFEASRTEPNRQKPAKPAAPQEGGAAAISPPAPAPAVTPAAPAEKPAVTAEKPANPAETSRPDKPVRVIQGVTPMNPGAAPPSQ